MAKFIGSPFDASEVMEIMNAPRVPLKEENGHVVYTDITERNTLSDSFLQANMDSTLGGKSDGVIIIGNAIAYDVRGCATEKECSWLMAEKLESIGNALISMAEDMRKTGE